MTNKERKKIFFELFDKLPKDIADRAKKNYNPNYAKKTIVFNTLSQAIYGGFLWSQTAEGDDFWNFVQDDEIKLARKSLIKRKCELVKLIKSIQKKIELL